MTALFVFVFLLILESQLSRTDDPQIPEANENVTETDWQAILNACMACLIFLIASVALMFYTQDREMRKAKRRDREREDIYQRDQIMARTAHAPLLDAMQVRDTLVPSLHIPIVLSETTMMRLGGKERIIERYIQFLRATDDQLGATDLMKLPEALHPDIPVRRDTQVTVTVDGRTEYLHMNKLIDFVGNTITIGQPPANRRQLDLHWQAIWDGKIGCLVWIGNVHCVGDRKIWFEAYAPVDAWKTEDAVWPIGPFKIKVLESFVQKNVDSHFVHKIEMSKKDQRNVEVRHIWIIHIDLWDEVRTKGFDWNSKPAFIKKIVDAISYTHYELFRRPKKDDVQLSNLLVNCPSGVDQSVTYVILYICRQMWMHRGKARVEAVVKYVRRHRYMAWGMLTPHQLHSELKIVYRSMKMIMNQLYEQEWKRKKSTMLKEAQLEKSVKRKPKASDMP